MRTVVVQGGWRVWAMLIVGGALLLAVGLVASLFLLGAAVIGALVLVSYRALYALGLVGRRPSMDTPTAAGETVIDGDFHVVNRPVRQLPVPHDHHRDEPRDSALNR
jgi:hypothetical protein